MNCDDFNFQIKKRKKKLFELEISQRQSAIKRCITIIIIIRSNMYFRKYVKWNTRSYDYVWNPFICSRSKHTENISYKSKWKKKKKKKMKMKKPENIYLRHVCTHFHSFCLIAYKYNSVRCILILKIVLCVCVCCVCYFILKRENIFLFRYPKARRLNWIIETC